MNYLKRMMASGLVSLSLLAGTPGCTLPERPQQQVNQEDVLRNDVLRNGVLSYFTQPTFSGEDSMKQVTGTDAELEIQNLDEGMVYLSIPSDSLNDQTISKLTTHPELVEFGKVNGNGLELGSYTLNKPGSYFFRFPSDTFRVDPSATITKQFDNSQYTITMQELVGFISNESIYGGRLGFEVGKTSGGRPIVTSNFGAFVSPNEPSLERLVRTLTNDSDSKEVKAQKLLNLITTQLKFNKEEMERSYETLKRTNEVLMTGGSDCSGLTTAYASLLEQIPIDYKLAYSDRHINVLVAGNFPNRNGLQFNFGGRQFATAETTIEGFEIGLTKVEDLDKFLDIEYLQVPGKDSVIYDARTGNKVN